jgi:deazaflavin-dependent oxidoreductase (nitroreductase family)
MLAHPPGHATSDGCDRLRTPRKAPLIKVHDGDTYIAVASFGGAPKHPVWYLNLVADPHVMVQEGPVA